MKHGGRRFSQTLHDCVYWKCDCWKFDLKYDDWYDFKSM